MNCEQVEEILGAYALDALPDNERLEVAAHVAECELHPELTELQATAQSLYQAVEPRVPSAGLRASLLAAAVAERAPASEAEPAPRNEPLSFTRPAARPWRSLAPYAVAAVFAIAAVGMFAWNLSLQNNDGSTTLAASFPSVGEAGGEVIYLEERDLVVVQVHGMDPLDDERTYQLWRIGNDGVESLGLLGNAPTGGLTFTGNLSESDSIGISIEPASGSEQPTTDPLMIASF